jgi:hypothetical protein
MNVDVRYLPRVWTGAVLVAVLLAAGVLIDRSISGPGGPNSSLPAAEGSTSAVATATLDDTPAAREFSAMLPLRLHLHDPMGHARSGQLPWGINVSDADRVLDPSAGEIYYWPPSGHIGIFYVDLDQTVSTPGLVPLGTVSSGLDELVSAGNRFTVWVDRADGTGT